MLESRVQFSRNKRDVGLDAGSLWVEFLSWDSSTWGDFSAPDIRWCVGVNMCGEDKRDGFHLGHYGLIQISFNLVKRINSMFISNW